MFRMLSPRDHLHFAIKIYEQRLSTANKSVVKAEAWLTLYENVHGHRCICEQRKTHCAEKRTKIAGLWATLTSKFDVWSTPLPTNGDFKENLLSMSPRRLLIVCLRALVGCARTIGRGLSNGNVSSVSVARPQKKHQKSALLPFCEGIFW